VADPVSWLVIEPGWKVLGSDGSELGSVAELVGDTGKDIFNGLVVSPGLLRHNRYVPAERVSSIVEGRIDLDLSHDTFESLPEHQEPASQAEVRADTTDLR
jgi:hypothetical protein